MIKKFLNNNSWIQKRVYVFEKISIDLFISIILLYLILNNKIYDEINIPIFLVIQFSWIFISYILGRYSENYRKIKVAFSSISLKSIASFIFILIFCLGLSFKNVFINKEFIYILFLGLFISNFLLFIISINQILKIRQIKKWLFIGDQEQFNKFKYYLKQSNYFDGEFFMSENIDLENSLKNYTGIIVCKSGKLSMIQLDKLRRSRKSFFILENVSEWSEMKLNLIPSELIEQEKVNQIIKNHYLNKIELIIKRIGDIFVSFLILIFASPLLLVSILIIKIQDNGNIFYSQIRTGCKQKEFRIFKLRTMKINAEEKGAKWSSRRDSRITFFGNLLRISRIDELPQLWNVIRGDMSLIGPRPERPIFDNELEKKLNYYNLRYLIKPGITGWAQVNYTYTDSIETSKIKLGYDLYYIKNMSFKLDFLIFLKTIKTILTFTGALPR